jgi:hypothetical protein
LNRQTARATLSALPAASRQAKPPPRDLADGEERKGRNETKHVNVTEEAAKETRHRVVHHQPQLLIYPGRVVIYSTHPYSLSF